MFIIEVLPIGRGIAHDALSYFSHVAHPRGSLIEIPIRKKQMPAIVLSAVDAFTMKTALRAATFSLRKLPDQVSAGAVSREFFETAELASAYHGVGVSQILSAMLPKEIREGTVAFGIASEPVEHLTPTEQKPLIFIAPSHDRYSEYERMVRESFAARASILFVVPTIEHAHAFTDMLAKGTLDYTVLLHSGRGVRALRRAYGMIAEEVHPLLIIATPQYASVLRNDIGCVILEHERGNGYVGKVRPYINYRFVLTTYAELLGATCILADTIVRTEEIYALKSGLALPYREFPKRLELQGTLSVISMKPDSNGATAFALFSKKLEKAISTAIESRKHVFLFGARRGLAPLVVCIDCGHIIRDPESGAPLALLRTLKDGVEKRWLVSSVSGYRIPAYDLCQKCGSWRLRERGIGIQQIYDEVIKKYDPKVVTLFDHLTAGTHKKAEILRDHFYGSRGGILLGTALALTYLREPVDVSAVVSMDSLRAIPSWRGEEETFAVLSILREKTLGTVFVQTRAETEDEIFVHASQGALSDFYDRELQVRKQFGYPPYMVFVHLAWRELQDDDGAFRRSVIETFAPHDISIYSAPYAEERGGVVYGLLRVPQELWPSADIAGRLRMLPPSVRISINPDRII